MTQTFPSPAGQNPAATGVSPFSGFPSGQDLYDLIMSQIEPELTSSQLPLLQQKYGTEVPELAQARQVRYEKAFAEYEKRFNSWTVQLSTIVHAYQRNAIASAEMNVKAKENDDMAGLEASIASA